MPGRWTAKTELSGLTSVCISSGIPWPVADSYCRPKSLMASQGEPHLFRPLLWITTSLHERNVSRETGASNGPLIPQIDLLSGGRNRQSLGSAANSSDIDCAVADTAKSGIGHQTKLQVRKPDAARVSRQENRTWPSLLDRSFPSTRSLPVQSGPYWPGLNHCQSRTALAGSQRPCALNPDQIPLRSWLNTSHSPRPGSVRHHRARTSHQLPGGTA
jgi:hypothetical protein